MIVCVCRRVSDREIARHAKAGMDFDDIQFELGVATQCGQCEGCARDIVAQCRFHPELGFPLTYSMTQKFIEDGNYALELTDFEVLQ